MYRLGICIAFILQSAFAYSQSAHKYLLDGNSKFQNEQYGGAELDYRKALEQDESMKAKYNLGGSVYQQQRFEEAAEQFNGAVEQAKTDLEKGSAYYNLGNSLLKADKIDESIGAYKEALKYLPKDQAAWHNLANARLRKMQQQQQEQQGQDGEEENNEEQEQEQQEGDEDQQQQEQAEGGEPQESESENREEEAEEAKENIDLEDALKLLQAIENEDQKVQEKMRKRSGSKKKPVKDW